MDEQPKQVVAVVSYWYIPGGYDYMNARVEKRYFTDMQQAEQFAAQNEYPPEMALLEVIK